MAMDLPDQPSTRDPQSGDVLFRSPDRLEGRFCLGAGGDLSLRLCAGGAELMIAAGYPARLGDGEAPARIELLADTVRFEAGAASDFAAATVRATYPGGAVILHTRKVFFKQRDYWIVVDRLKPETPREQPHTASLLFTLGAAAPELHPTALRLTTEPTANGARLAVFPMMTMGLQGRVRQIAAGSRLVLEHAGDATGEIQFVTLLHPIGPGETSQIKAVEGIEADSALAMRIFFHDQWIHTFVDTDRHGGGLLLNFLPIRAEISLLEVTPAGDLSRRLEAGRRA